MFETEIAPFEGPKTATLAYEEWGLFMKELYDMKRIHMREGKIIEGMDLLGMPVDDSFRSWITNIITQALS